MLGVILGLDLLRAWRGASINTDYAGHISSWVVGVLAGLYIRYNASAKQSSTQQMTRQESNAPQAIESTS